MLNLQGLIPGEAIESETSISIRVLRRRDKLPGCTHCGSEEPARGVPEFAFKRAIFENPRHFGFDLATTARLLEGLIHEVTSTESAG